MTAVAEKALHHEGTEKLLPKGWRWVQLADIGPTTDGDWILNSDYAPSGVRLLQIGDVGVGRFIGKSSRFVSLARAKELNCTLLRPGDVLISRMPDPIGRACILPNLGYPCITAVDVSVWRPRPEIVDVEFVTHYLNGPEWLERVQSLASGATRPRISRSNLDSIEIPLPPLAEQKRIAELLSERITKVEQARKALQAQLQAAAALPAAFLREVFTSPQAQSWPRKRLGDVLRLRKEIVHPHDKPKGPAVFVGLEHIEPSTGRRVGSLDVEMSKLTGRKPRFHTGDIVYGYLRPYLNKIWIADFDGLCSVDQFAFEVESRLALTGFVAWFMRSPVYLERSRINTTTGQLPRIGTGEVAGVEFGCPPLDEQRTVLRSIDSRMGDIEKLQHGMQSQLAALDHLPASLLRRAFAGECR